MTASALNDAIVLDKLRAVRKTVAISIPVNMLLGVAALAVAIHAGKGAAGALWFSFSLAINITRLLFCRYPIGNDRREPGEATGARASRRALSVGRHLTLHCVFAFLSGFAWALIPFLCDGYTTPETVFYLAVVCGITAGAVTHGFAYAVIPIVFITPPLVSLIGCLLYSGGYDRNWLAATVLLYLLALIRGSRVGEELVDNQSRLKNEATFLSRSLETANHRITLFARDMRERATHDDLTGLLNRRGFAEVLVSRGQTGQETLSEGAARRDEHVAGRHFLLLFDLDGFKTINDAFGHKTGDMILVEVAGRLRAYLPADTPLARLGGDEFAALVDLPAGDAGPEAIAKDLIAAIAAPFARLPAGRIGVSIGICECDDDNLDTLLVAADVALYAAKNTGRNRFRIFDEALRRRAQMTRDIERDLAAAMAQQALTMWYQPIMAENGTRVDTLEALVRWQHPAHGFIPPMELVAVSALSGLSGDLLRYILREITEMVALLRQNGFDDVRVAMNVSPREMTQMSVDELVISEFKALGLPLSMLEIEITEEVAIDPAAVKGKLDRLTQAGVRLAIDDFGTGYSSLSALQSLPIHRVKIDRGLIHSIAASPERQALVDAVLHVSKSFGFEVVGEGVETPEDQATLEELGCPLMQGYALSRPRPREEIVGWMESGRKAGPANEELAP
ncbi:hypothetical protein BJF92_23710 [Rhizobium rhizosphaerae]|uniref:Uncharacterized protein n=1 Tax=Xaviernesmea rhizosphaerae TaxID=1672749 RepID=A0A1Q9APT0_9HYPH|nr:EAL domain-containing protein [Xaviernesmea rhizosphaerae]OLP57432.1 hypothetical protein BJF92_23710 [Xaviernesmea rhizosphaerae]